MPQSMRHYWDMWNESDVEKIRHHLDLAVATDSSNASTDSSASLKKRLSLPGLTPEVTGCVPARSSVLVFVADASYRDDAAWLFGV